MPQVRFGQITVVETGVCEFGTWELSDTYVGTVCRHRAQIRAREVCAIEVRTSHGASLEGCTVELPVRQIRSKKNGALQLGLMCYAGMEIRERQFGVLQLCVVESCQLQVGIGQSCMSQNGALEVGLR